jgi:glycosidase
VVYGVVPPLFGEHPFRAVTAKLDSLREVGIDALWLSPVNETLPGDFGYAVTDYFYDRDLRGQATHYFDWAHLPNLNYGNPKVAEWMTRAFLHWVQEYGVDGFRVDVAWGVKERQPELRLAPCTSRIRSLRPSRGRTRTGSGSTTGGSFTCASHSRHWPRGAGRR